MGKQLILRQPYAAVLLLQGAYQCGDELLLPGYDPFQQNLIRHLIHVEGVHDKAGAVFLSYVERDGSHPSQIPVILRTDSTDRPQRTYRTTHLSHEFPSFSSLPPPRIYNSFLIMWRSRDCRMKKPKGSLWIRTM